jgi:hypothetical protein
VARLTQAGRKPATLAATALMIIGLAAISPPADAHGTDPDQATSRSGNDGKNLLNSQTNRDLTQQGQHLRKQSPDVLLLAQNNGPNNPLQILQQLLNQMPRSNQPPPPLPRWNPPPQPRWNQPPQPQANAQQQPSQNQPTQQSAEGARAEQAFRNALVMQGISGGFGGIFGPGLKKWVNTPSAPSSGGGDQCGGYSDYGAKQACKNGDGWAANRLQNNESDGSEHDWYNR